MAAAAALMAMMAFTAPASAQELDTQITTLDRATPVAAYGNTVAWSARDPLTGEYRLALLRGTRWGLLDLPARPIPFDVDVGPGPEGLALTYSRCALEPPERFAADLSVLPDYTRGRDCLMFRYDVRAKREVPLAGRREGVLPSLWRSRVAFVTPGTRQLREAATIGGRLLRSRGRGPAGMHATSLDLGSERRLASTWSGTAGSQVRLDLRLVARVPFPGRLLGMGFDVGVLYFRSTCGGSPSGCPESYWAYRPRSRSRYAAAEGSDLVAAAHGGGATYALLGTDRDGTIGCSGDDPCSLIREDQLEFSRVPR